MIDDEPAGTEVLAGSAYGSGEFRDHRENADKTPAIKPALLQPAVEGGFDLMSAGVHV